MEKKCACNVCTGKNICPKCNKGTLWVWDGEKNICMRCGHTKGDLVNKKKLQLCLKEKYNGSCCCTCANRYEDFYHCTTNPKPPWYNKEDHQCVCSIHKGYICLIDFKDGSQIKAHSNWSEHGMCELWIKKNKY